ncbi:MAG: zeta toxin family protein [Oscillospiraceae bacterium]|nr:zeta toxin family protein [Oscillospiraceae bacterium]
MSSNELSAYSDEQFEIQYRKLLYEIIKGRKQVSEPYAIILGGQPGSGKTTLHERARQKNRNIIIINGDEYRQFHPNFIALNDIYGKESATYSQPFANSVVERLINELSDAKYNLVIEGTLRTTEVPLNTCRILKNKGYTVELSVMAVDKEQSWQGTLDRYNDMDARGMTPRATPKEHHDLVVAALPDNISELYLSGEFDQITLYSRELDCLYNSIETPGTNPNEILKAALEGR